MKVHGFPSLEDYHHESSPGYCLPFIRTPLIAINSKDDPFIPATSEPSPQLYCTTQFFRDGSKANPLHIITLTCDHLALLTSSVLGLPIDKFQSNPQTVLIVPQRGGHFGFIEGLFPFGATWMDRTLRQLLKALRNSREL